jgi:hypothetical protein
MGKTGAASPPARPPQTGDGEVTAHWPNRPERYVDGPGPRPQGIMDGAQTTETVAVNHRPVAIRGQLPGLQFLEGHSPVAAD